MGGEAERDATFVDDERALERRVSDAKRAPSAYELSLQTSRQIRVEAEPESDPIVRIELPRRSLDEWRSSGLTRARPNLPQLLALLRDAYQAARGVALLRADFDWLDRHGRDADGQVAWENLRERVSSLKLAMAASEWDAGPALRQTLDDFTAARGSGEQQLDAAVALLTETADPDARSRLDDVVKRLREQLRALQAHSTTVGEACHDASLQAAAMVCRALDEVMRVVPDEQRPSEPQTSHRAVPLTEKRLAAPPPADAQPATSKEQELE